MNHIVNSVRFPDPADHLIRTDLRIAQLCKKSGKQDPVILTAMEVIVADYSLAMLIHQSWDGIRKAYRKSAVNRTNKLCQVVVSKLKDFVNYIENNMDDPQPLTKAKFILYLQRLVDNVLTNETGPQEVLSWIVSEFLDPNENPLEFGKTFTTENYKDVLGASSTILATVLTPSDEGNVNWSTGHLAILR